MARRPGSALLTRTTYRLIRPFEAVTLLVQSMNLFASAFNDRYLPYGLSIVLALGVVHLGFAYLALRHRGPLTRGRVWTAAWIAMIFVVQALDAHLIAPGDYAAYGVGVPMGGYAFTPLALFAFYPWAEFREPRRRWLIEAVLGVAIVAHPLLLIGLMNRWHLTGAHLRSVGQFAAWALVWFLVGKGMAWLCRISADMETRALSESYETALGDLHTVVDGAAARIEAGYDARAVARQLREVTAGRRAQLLLVDDTVGVVDLVRNAVRAHGDRLVVRSAPRLGALTIPRESAIIIDQALADLLKNVVQHGGGVTDLSFELRGEQIELRVRDHGPGLTDAQSAEPGTSSLRLRIRVRAAGGDLRVLPAPSDGGAVVELTLPLRPGR